MAIISIQDLRVVRGGTEILKGIQWEVAAKENWVILGANGSGKTTLLNCVTGYVTPSAGTIEVLGKQYGKADWRELRKKVGLVSSGIRHWIEDPQTALDVVASGRNAELNLWHSAKGPLLREARRSLRLVECANLANRPWAFLSQGERQRVLIGRALVARHRVLILDEPCAGLDPVARERFLQFVSRLGSSAETPNLIFVTHHVEEILPCFDKALLLRAGEIFSQGAIRKVITSKAMGQAFGAAMTVLNRQGRFQLQFKICGRQTTRSGFGTEAANLRDGPRAFSAVPRAS
ncbi:MAG: ATP-binding cassette domain-containing protein [Verrucomicrobia bacterium]|nr:ATP-binding cassette domain-containing protein [Verrucomicrobiota bacterium]